MNKLEIITKLEDGKLKEHIEGNIELKRSWSEKHGKRISSLCNKIAYKNMWLIIGVDDDGSLYGHDESWAKATEEVISQNLNNKLDPFQACLSISCENVNNSWVVIVELLNPGAVVMWDKNAYKSTGSTTQEMSPQEIMELNIKLPGLIDYSKQKCKREVDENIVKVFCDELREKNTELQTIVETENLLQRIHLHSTNAEKILFGETYYRIVKTNKNHEIIENSSFSGLYKILNEEFFQDVKNWFNRESPKACAISGKILRESLANTVAHAAYNENGGEVLIELFHDKLTISNLCFPEYSAFANKWFSRIHKSPNSFLMESLRLVRKVDELGRGKNVIFTESLKSGYRPPIVEITTVGRLNRWTLNIYCGISDQKNIRLYEKIREMYGDTNKSLIAFALVLWRGIKVKKILDYFGKEEHGILAEVLADLNGPIYYYKQDDEIVLNRWVRLLLEEGCESKSFSPFEEERLFKFARDMQSGYHGGYITPKELRKFSNMGESPSERTLCSKMISKWTTEGKLEKIKQGQYKFTTLEAQSRTERALKLLEMFETHNKQKNNT